MSDVRLYLGDCLSILPTLAAADDIYTVTDPPLRFIGRLVPPLRLGGVALDVGFLILYFGLTILQRVVLVAFS